MKNIFISMLALCLWAIIGLQTASAFTFTLSERQLNSMVAAVFPQTRMYDDIQLTFSDPQLHLGPAKHQVAVKVAVLAARGGQQLNATATLSGQIFYHGEQKQLQVNQPTLNKLHWEDNPGVVPEALLNGVKRLEGQALPGMVLLDFALFDMSAFGIGQPKHVEVTPHGLLIEL